MLTPVFFLQKQVRVTLEGKVNACRFPAEAGGVADLRRHQAIR
jgi:hypothetical protein